MRVDGVVSIICLALGCGVSHDAYGFAGGEGERVDGGHCRGPDATRAIDPAGGGAIMVDAFYNDCGGLSGAMFASLQHGRARVRLSGW
jgi:hypothetical protein